MNSPTFSRQPFGYAAKASSFDAREASGGAESEHLSSFRFPHTAGHANRNFYLLPPR